MSILRPWKNGSDGSLSPNDVTASPRGELKAVRDAFDKPVVSHGHRSRWSKQQCVRERARERNMPFAVRVLTTGDAALLSRVAEGVFDNPVDPQRSAEFLRDPRLHMAVAIDSGLVVGFASGVDYIHPDKPAEMWINEVGVAPTHRQQGIGKAVLGALLSDAKRLGCRSAWVLTDKSNESAIALYTAIGGNAGIEGASDAIVGFEFNLAGPNPDSPH